MKSCLVIGVPAAIVLAGVLGACGTEQASVTGDSVSSGTTSSVPSLAADDVVGKVVATSDLQVSKPPFSYAELSGLTRLGNQYLTVDDKSPDGRNSGEPSVNQAVLGFSESDAHVADATVKPYLALPERKMQKLESITTTPDGKFQITSTAFNKLDPVTLDHWSFNVTIGWNTARPENAFLIGSAPGTAKDKKMSLGIRMGLSRALANYLNNPKPNPDDTNYMRVEGLAATEDHLLFGIRQYGPSEENSTDSVIIVSMPYTTTDWTLTADWLQSQVVYAMNDETRAQAPMGPVGLSDISYDPVTKGLYILTSYEKDLSDTAPTSAELHGFMWSITPDQMANGTASIVRTADGKPIQFDSKTEGLTKMPDGNFLIVSDNDDYAIVNGQTRPVDALTKSPTYVVSLAGGATTP